MVNGNLTDWFEYPYNYSNGSEVTGFGSFIQYVSFSVGNWLGYGILTIIWVLIFGFSMASGSRKAMLTASFITFILSIYLIRMGIVNPVIAILFIVMTIIGAIGSKGEPSY